MVRRPAAISRLTVLLLVLSACATTAENTVEAPAELATVHPELYRAWRGTDAAALRPYFADNAIVATPDDRYNGWADIESRWVAPALAGMRDFELRDVTFTREGADIIETGRYSFKMTMEGEAEEVMSGGYAQRWQRQPDGSWRIVAVTVQ